MQILIRPDGLVRCIYSETFDLSSLGNLAIARGSHVEPMSDGNWTADMTPVDGPILGPFERRSTALRAEQDWLELHWLRRSE